MKPYYSPFACLLCGSTFYPRNSTHKFCSFDCYSPKATIGERVLAIREWMNAPDGIVVFRRETLR